MKIENFKYVSHLKVMRFNRRLCPGDKSLGPIFYFESPYEFAYDRDGTPRAWRIPKFDANVDPNDACRNAKLNVFTDFASVPPFFRGLVSRIGSHSEAAVVHDFLYLLRHDYVKDRVEEDTGQPPGEMSREEADLVILRALEEAKVGWIKRYVIYLAVCLAGWWVYKDLAEKPIGKTVIWLARILGLVLLVWIIQAIIW